MGVNIHGEHHRISEVFEAIESFVNKNGGYRKGALSPSEFFYKVADQFGVVLDDWFVTVYNEYYSDSGYNPSYEFDNAVQRYYFPLKDFDEAPYGQEFDLPYHSFGDGANAEEILESLFEDEFGYDGTFGYKARNGDEDE